MAYTLIEVSRKTQIPHTKLKFWIKKGLFSYVERGDNGVHYFSEQDIHWARWVGYFRLSKMSIKELKIYEKLLYEGAQKYRQKRLEMLKIQKKKLDVELEKLSQIAKFFTQSIEECEQRIKNKESHKGILPPQI